MEDSRNLAVHIVQKLANAGYTAFFAGGWVRDYLLGHPSDDIDIATNAPPQVVLDLFPRTIRVGVTFCVVIVELEGHQFEVASFRKDISYSNGRKPDKVEMSTPEEDALRRDFTINGMFYNPLNEDIFDYVGGMHDLKAGIIRCIRNPDERFKEDRLRMIRAVRFANRFGFHIDLDTQNAIMENCETLLPAVAMERIWQEFNKMVQQPTFDNAVISMHRLGLLGVIFPSLRQTHLNTIKHYVAPFHCFPKNTPTLFYILQLFPNDSLDTILELCTYLKLSGDEKKLATCWMELKSLESNPLTSRYAWAKFYADPYSIQCVEIFACTLDKKRSDEFLSRHSLIRDALNTHIERLIHKKPLVTSTLLQQEGIPASVLMGKLMKQAEEISIEKNINDPTIVIKQLKQTDLWPIQ